MVLFTVEDGLKSLENELDSLKVTHTFDRGYSNHLTLLRE